MNDMTSNNPRNLLDTLDRMMEELKEMRMEVASLLSERADLQARLAEMEAALDKKVVPEVASPKLEEAIQEPVQQVEEVEEKHFDRLLLGTEPQKAMNDVFVPMDEADDLDVVFEDQIAFEVVHRFSLADRYYYANEFFHGDQGSFVEALENIERMSSWSQVENYLYEVLRLNSGDSVVKDFAKIIKECSH